MLRVQKETIIDGVRREFDAMTSAVFLDFRGMSVEEVSQLRRNFHDRGVKYRVVKNTLIRRALRGGGFDAELKSALRGMTGIAFSYEEPSAAARVCKEFVKDNEKLKIKAGLIEGRIIDARAVEHELATLPSKPEARARLLATLQTPAQQLVMLLNAPASTFVRLLRAKAEA